MGHFKKGEKCIRALKLGEKCGMDLVICIQRGAICQDKIFICKPELAEIEGRCLEPNDQTDNNNLIWVYMLIFTFAGILLVIIGVCVYKLYYQRRMGLELYTFDNPYASAPV